MIFFPIAYRRHQSTQLYFFPTSTEEWPSGETILYFIFLSPLTVASQSTLDVLLRYTSQSSVPLNFVWFPESSPSEDTIESAIDMTRMDLLYVRPPNLSKLFVHLVTKTTITGNGSTPSSLALSSSSLSLDIIDTTLSYSGSVQAELEESYANQSPHTEYNLDDDDELHADATVDSGVTESEDDMLGYSADTIDSVNVATLNQRLRESNCRNGRRENSSNWTIFYTAAPLHPVESGSRFYHRDMNGDHSPSGDIGNDGDKSPQSIRMLALLRPRQVPTLKHFLIGQAPSQIHILLNQYSNSYIRANILRLDRSSKQPSPQHSTPTSASYTSTSLLDPLDHFTSTEESAGLSEIHLALASWIQQRWLHHEQQLSLLAIHSCYHRLPSTLSASNIPVGEPIHFYTHPVSSIRLATYVVIDWTVIIFTTILIRNGRAWWEGH